MSCWRSTGGIIAAPAASHSFGKRGQLSRHFHSRELDCPHCGSCFVVDELVALLERIRGSTGRPLPVLGGYRCPWHNYSVGGAGDSQHVYGTAADLRERLVSPQQALRAGAQGIGVRNGWVVHVDVRRGGRAQWVE